MYEDEHLVDHLIDHALRFAVCSLKVGGLSLVAMDYLIHPCRNGFRDCDLWFGFGVFESGNQVWGL